MAGFADVLGHEQTIAHMKKAIELGKVSHAYIINGEKGSGKKLLAGIFAQTLQCQEKGTEPCMHCQSCLQAQSMNQPDIIRVTHETYRSNPTAVPTRSILWMKRRNCRHRRRMPF